MTLLSFLSDLLKGSLLLLAYATGLKSKEVEIEAKTNKAALKEVNERMKKQDKIRAQYDNLKVTLPNEWGTINDSVYSTPPPVPKAGKAAVRAGGGRV